MISRAAAFFALVTLCASRPAAAGEVDDSVTEARAAIVARDFKAATKALDAATAAAPTAETVVPGSTLARIWYYRGVVEQLQGDKKGKAIDHWRAALVLDSTYPWDMALLTADEPESLFEALRSEVRSRDKVAIGAPSAIGTAKLFVDGAKATADSKVLTGQHLAQITCPDGKTYGVWTDFAKPVKWLAMCPGGVDVSVVVAEAPVDEWAEFGPAFGAPSDGNSELMNVPFQAEAGGTEEPTPAPGEEPAVASAAVVAPTASPPPVEAPAPPIEAPVETPAPVAVVAEKPVETPAPVAAPVVAEKPVEAPVETPTPVAVVAEKPVETPVPVAVVAEKPIEKPVETPEPEKQPIAKADDRRGLGAGVFLMAGGGALLAGGVATNFLVVYPTWGAIEDARANPLSVTRDQADALTSRFNLTRGLTLGLLTGGVALTGVGVFLEAPVRPMIGPGQLGVTGSF